MTSPAVVNYASAKQSVELREVPLPEIGPTDVLLKVAAVGVCGSDLHQWTGDHSWEVNYPVILGHEFCGEVEQLGVGVTQYEVGDRVVSETAAVIDENNPMSRAGQYQLDPSRKGFGYGIDGAMTGYVSVPARCLHTLPASLSFAHAALTEPCCVAYSATVANARIMPGDRIVVFGPGTIGLLCAAMATLCGAKVAVVGLPADRDRLKIAEDSYGCTPIIGDPQQWASETDGLGADGVIDAAGVSATLKQAIAIVRPRGWISKVGWGIQPLDFSLDPIVQKNVTLQGSFSHNWPVWERVLRLLADGALDVRPLLGGEWPLHQWRDAFESMHQGEIVKAILRP
ncbi:MAG: zinc-binding dehydrogenase [Bythopirellula sp.]